MTVGCTPKGAGTVQCLVDYQHTTINTKIPTLLWERTFGGFYLTQQRPGMPMLTCIRTSSSRYDHCMMVFDRV